jgi:hypothetical protein
LASRHRVAHGGRSVSDIGGIIVAHKPGRRQRIERADGGAGHGQALLHHALVLIGAQIALNGGDGGNREWERFKCLTHIAGDGGFECRGHINSPWFEPAIRPARH